MTKGRLEAYSDGVLAILITIMVLELRVPHEPELGALVPLLPVFLTYVLSFIVLATYWNGHHHMLHAARHINGNVLWANSHLLFWLSLMPFVTGWMGENHFAPVPTAAYGVVNLGAGIAFRILFWALIKAEGAESTLAQAVGRDPKGIISVLCYAASIPFAFVSPWISGGLFTFVALMWLKPDRRIEKRLA